MKEQLLAMEKCFFKTSYMNDICWLDQTLHDHYLECGKSGGLYDKNTVMKALLACHEDRRVALDNFECEKVNDACWIVHYITKDEQRFIYRTSLWVLEAGKLKLYFHQASPLKYEPIGS